MTRPAASRSSSHHTRRPLGRPDAWVSHYCHNWPTTVICGLRPRHWLSLQAGEALANSVEMNLSSHQCETMHQLTGRCGRLNPGLASWSSEFRQARQTSGRIEPPVAFPAALTSPWTLNTLCCNTLWTSRQIVRLIYSSRPWMTT